MEEHVQIVTLVIGAVGGAIVTLCGALTVALVLWQKYKTGRAQSAKDDADAEDKVNEVNDRKRKKDAIFHNEEIAGIIEKWENIAAERQEYADRQLAEQRRDFENKLHDQQSVIDQLREGHKAMNVELEKRRNEHVECLKADATKTAQIEFLTVSNKELRERVAALEKGKVQR